MKTFEEIFDEELEKFLSSPECKIPERVHRAMMRTMGIRNKDGFSIAQAMAMKRVHDQAVDLCLENVTITAEDREDGLYSNIEIDEQSILKVKDLLQ